MDGDQGEEVDERRRDEKKTARETLLRRAKASKQM
jgi:hypothetical protein